MIDQLKQCGYALFGLLFVCLTLPQPSIAEPVLPESFSVTYVLKKGPIELAEMTRRLYKNGSDNYIYESYSEPVGYARWFTDTTLLEKSEWIFHNNELRPLNYSYDRKGDDRDRHVHLHFDWDKMRVINTINNDPWSMEIPDGTLDKLLYHLAVMYDLERGRESLNYKIADGGKLKNYEFINHGEELLRTKMGELKTIRIELPGKKRDTIIWCAVDYKYLPVKLIQADDSNELVLTLKSFSGISRRADSTTAIAEPKSAAE